MRCAGQGDQLRGKTVMGPGTMIASNFQRGYREKRAAKGQGDHDHAFVATWWSWVELGGQAAGELVVLLHARGHRMASILFAWSASRRSRLLRSASLRPG